MSLETRLSALAAAIGEDMQVALGLAGGVVADPWTYVQLASNFANNTTTLTNVTGMSFVGEANTVYEVEILGVFQTAVTTTGLGLAFDIPSGSVYGLGFHHATTAGSLSTTEQIADAAVTTPSTGVRANNTNTPIIGRYLVSVGATGGTVQLQMRSEIASSAVTLQGGLFFLKYRKATGQSTSGPIIPITQADYDALGVKNPAALYVIVATVTTGPNTRWRKVTAAQYAAIGTKEAGTLYVVDG